MERQQSSFSSATTATTTNGSTTMYGKGATTFDLFGSRSRLFNSFFQISKKDNLKIFLPSVCHLFGVIIFMRLGEIVGTMGLFYTWFIITITFFITFFTIGSMSALLSTNIHHQQESPPNGGGWGGLLSRLDHILGDPLGKFMGILFYFAFAVATSYYLLGFTEITLYYLAETNANTWTTIGFASTLLGLLHLIFVCGFMTGISMRFLRLVFGLMMISILFHIIFLLIPNDSWSTGFSIQTLQRNSLLPQGHDVLFFHMLSTFFPAFCGVLSGSNLADLTSQYIPSKVLIIGVHQALFFGLVIYFILTFVLASCVDSSILQHQVYIVQNIIDADLKIPIIYISITLTTLSSAFGNILNATHVLTSLVGPSSSSSSAAISLEETVHLMPKEMKKTTNTIISPTVMVIGTTWFVSQCTLLLYGQVDLILPMLSGMFLLIFSMINLTVFYQEFTSSSTCANSFHPSFQMYSKWTALLGCLLSFSGFFYILAFSNLLMSLLFGLMVLGFILYHRHQLFLLLTSQTTSRHRKTNAQEWSGPHESNDAQMTRKIQLAALYIRDGLHGRFIGDKKYLLNDTNIERTNVKRIFHALHFVRNGNLTLFLLLGFFEKPSWCFFETNATRFNEDVLTSNLPMFSIQVSILIEFFCLVVLTGEMLMKYYFLGKELYYLNKWHSIQMGLVFIDFIFVFTSATSISTNQIKIHLSPLIRPLILISTSHRLRSAFYSLFKSMPRFLDGLLVLTVLIILYGICGMILFEGTEEGRLYFNTFQDACLNLLILLTTANFPDIMMPIFQQLRLSSLFFISFLLIGLFYVMNLFFASIFQNYRQEIQKNTFKFQKKRQLALQTAFELLLTHPEEDSTITRHTCQLLLTELSRPTMSIFDWHIPPPPPPRKQKDTTECQLLLKEVLTFDQFVKLIKSIFKNKKKKDSHFRPHGHSSTTSSSRNRFGSAWMNSFSLFIQSSSFEHWIDLIILLNLVAILMEIQSKIDHKIDQMVKIERFVMPCFTVIYLLEMMVKMFFYGSVKKYLTRQRKNIFDCIVTLIIFTTELSIHLHYDQPQNFHWRLIRIILFLRFLRCLRLLVALKALNSMFDMLIRLIPAFTTLYGMLAVVMAEYAAIGMHLFGGKLRVDDPILANTTYGHSNYYANNFNDYASALITLFELLVVNNWYVIMEGAVAVTSKWSRLYFVSYYIIAVVMVLNLVIAFVVEAYFEQVSVAEEDEDDDIGAGGGVNNRCTDHYHSLDSKTKADHITHLRQRSSKGGGMSDSSSHEDDIFRRAANETPMSIGSVAIEDVL